MRGRWPVVALGQLAESVDYGLTASATRHGSGPKFLRITDIQDGSVDWDTVPWCNCDDRAAVDSRLRPGDIVFARTGATTGKSFLIRECPSDAVFASYLIRVRAGADLYPGFLGHFFQTPRYWAQITKNARGVAQPGINASTLKALEVPLPPVAEQQRIAEVLDRAEALRAKRRAALATLDTLTQSIFLDLFGDPVRNPKGLPTVSLGQLGDWQSGGTPPRTRGDYFQGGVPWFSSGELSEMVVLASEENISEAALRETSAKAVPSGALLLGMYDTAALKASIAGRSCSCNQAIAFATLDSKAVVTQFVYFAVVIGRDDFRRLQRGVRQKNLNLSMVRDIRIPLPPLAHQHDFARRVAAVERLKAAHRASLAEMDALFASLQHRAFRGEL